MQPQYLGSIDSSGEIHQLQQHTKVGRTVRPVTEVNSDINEIIKLFAVYMQYIAVGPQIIHSYTYVYEVV